MWPVDRAETSFVGRLGLVALDVAAGRRDDARHALEAELDAPEAAAGEGGDVVAAVGPCGCVAS